MNFFNENCKIYSEKVLVNKIRGTVNSNKFTHSYDDFYLSVTFWLYLGSFSLVLHY